MTQPPSRTKFYLDKRNGKVMGVCAGIADYTGLDVTLVRIMFVSAVLMMNSIEDAFNRIWRVPTKRPPLARWQNRLRRASGERCSRPPSSGAALRPGRSSHARW